jgi:hypothetical protein
MAGGRFSWFTLFLGVDSGSFLGPEKASSLMSSGLMVREARVFPNVLIIVELFPGPSTPPRYLSRPFLPFVVISCTIERLLIAKAFDICGFLLALLANGFDFGTMIGSGCCLSCASQDRSRSWRTGRRRDESWVKLCLCRRVALITCLLA